MAETQSLQKNSQASRKSYPKIPDVHQYVNKIKVVDNSEASGVVRQVK